MGYAVKWYAVRSPAPGLLATLGLAETGELQQVPDAPLCYQRGPEGWSLLFSNRMRVLSDETLAELSQGGEVVACSVEEHVMFSQAEHWVNGALVFRVTHEAAKGLGHLSVEGTATHRLNEIHEAAKTRQATEGGEEAGVDHIFDVPVDLAQELCGFTHNSLRGAEQWVVVEEIAGESKFRRAGCLSTFALLLIVVIGCAAA